MTAANSSLDGAISARDNGDYQVALTRCLAVLSDTPEDPQARVLLANIFFLMECPELAAEEVAKLQSLYPERKSLRLLLQGLCPDGVDLAEPTKEGEEDSVAAEESEDSTKNEETDEVLAEGEFDFDDLDLLSDDD